MGTESDKQFNTLRAKFALRGHRFERVYHGDDVQPTYYAERWGLVRCLLDLEAAHRFLVQIGGAA